jgi:hydrogenase small subunit
MDSQMTRRDFIQTGAGAVSVLGFSLVKIPGLEPLCAGAEVETVAEVPVIWMATGACSGCSVALLNSASPSIQELLLGQVLPGKHVSLGFHATVMAASGEPAMEAMNRVVRDHPKGYVLIVDGATATKGGGEYCAVGEVDERPITGYEHVRDLGRDAMAVIAVGACAAYGGIPAAAPNPTECVSVAELFVREGISTPLVNIPGCPPHPDWIVGSIATVLLGGLGALELDQKGRPKAFFGECIHDNCPYRGHFERGEFAEHFGEHGCLLKLGCKGPITYADCPIRKFNNGTSWCIEAGHPCIGCCHPDFPFEKSLFAVVEPSQLSFPEAFPVAATTTREGRANGVDTHVAVGLVGATAFLAGVGVTMAAKKLGSADREEPGPATGSGPEQTDEDD